MSNIGTPWTSFQPTFTVSYLGNGWDLTGRVWGEINTENYLTGYRSGDVVHAEVTATKQFGNFKFGPIANFAGQVSNDKSSAYYNYLVQNNRSNVVAVGAMGGYDFGPAKLEIWAFHDVVSNSSDGTIAIGANAPTAPCLTAVLGRLSFRLWGPDAKPAPIQAKY